MKSSDIYQLIKKIDQHDGEHNFVIDIQRYGKFNGTKSDIIPALTEKYMQLRLSEFNVWLKEQKVSQKKISELMGINPVTFTQFLTGFVKTHKEIGDTSQFIWKVKHTIENNLSICKK